MLDLGTESIKFKSKQFIYVLHNVQLSHKMSVHHMCWPALLEFSLVLTDEQVNSLEKEQAAFWNETEKKDIE